MREILFRGKTFDNDWVYGYYVNQYKYPEIYCQDTSVGERRAIIAETVGQYTDLTDRNGNKIFEGDILIDTQSGVEYIMKWFKKYGCFAFANAKGSIEWEYTDIFIEDMKVVGNVFDNPELLEGDSEE